jgi:hypothetical protein
MTSSLFSRVCKLQAQVTPPTPAIRHVSRVVCRKGDEEAALELAKANGFDPDNEDHLLILRQIVTPVGQSAYSCPPYGG